MSRSHRKSPCIGVTARSSQPSAQKKFRSQENRKQRRRVRVELYVRLDDSLLPDPKRYGNEWASPRDGKCFSWDILNTKWMRK